jgi:hypothetical protein
LEEDLAIGGVVIVDAVDGPLPLAGPGRGRIGWGVLFPAVAAAFEPMDEASGVILDRQGTGVFVARTSAPLAITGEVSVASPPLATRVIIRPAAYWAPMAADEP